MPSTLDAPLVDLSFEPQEGGYGVDLGFVAELFLIAVSCCKEGASSLSSVRLTPAEVAGSLRLFLHADGRIELYAYTDVGQGGEEAVKASRCAEGIMLDESDLTTVRSWEASEMHPFDGQAHSSVGDGYLLDPAYLSEVGEKVFFSDEEGFDTVTVDRLTVFEVHARPQGYRLHGALDGPDGVCIALVGDRGVVAEVTGVRVERSGVPALDANGILDALREVVAGIEVGTDDDLWAAGLTSLDFVRLAGLLEERVGHGVPLQLVGVCRTASELAESLQRSRQEGGDVEPWPPLEDTSALDLHYYPLTPPQRQVWLAGQADDGASGFNVVLQFAVEGADLTAVARQAVARLLARHPMMAGQVVPGPKGVAHMRVPQDARARVDVEHVASAEDGALGEHQSRKFDLTHGPLMRAGLVEMHGGRGVLSLTFSHLVIDGASLPGVCEALEGREPTGGPAPDYARIAHWYAEPGVQKRLATEVEATELALAEVQPTRLLMAGDESAGLAAGVVEIDFDTAGARTISEAARAAGVGLHTLALAAYAAVMRDYCEGSLVVQLTTAARPMRAVQGTVGLFASPVLLPVPEPEAESARAWLAQLTSCVGGALSRQHAPMDEVLSRLGDRARTPLGLLFEDMPVPSLEVPGARTRWDQGRIDAAPAGSARLDLELVVGRSGGELRGQLVYRERAVDARVAAQIAARIKAVMYQLVRDPEVAVGGVIRRAQEGLPDTLSRLTGPGTTLRQAPNLLAEVSVHAQQRPASQAVTDGVSSLTYAELAGEVARVSAHISASVDVETQIVIDLQRGPNLVVAMLAVLHAGCRFVPVDRRQPEERLRELTESAEVGAWLSDYEALPFALPGHVVQLAWPGSGAGPRSASARRGRGAYTMLTTGSTGKPKPVLVSVDNLDNLLLAVTRIFGSGADTWLSLTTPTFDIALHELLFPLLHGGTVVIGPEVNSESGRTELANIARLAAQHNVSHFQSTPSLLRLLLAMDATGLSWMSELTAMMVTGEALPLSIARGVRQHFGGRLFNGYGPTETTVWASVWEVPVDASSILIGAPLANVALKVCDPMGKLVPRGVPGELLIGGRCVSLGYLGREAETAERFFTDDDGTRWYRSGDLVVIEPTGDLRWLSRMDRQLKIAGRRIEPAEVEVALVSHPGIAQAAVMASGDQDKQLCAYLVPAGQASASGAATGSSEAATKGGYQGEPRLDPWLDSVTGRRASREEELAWKASVTAHVEPTADALVVELGHGEAMLADALGRSAGRYVRADLAEVSAALCRSEAPDASDALRLQVAPDAANGAIDRIVITEGARAFASVEDLLTTLEALSRRLHPAGALVLADVRDGSLHEAEVATRLTALADDGTRLSVLRGRIANVCASEARLLVSPKLLRMAGAELLLQAGPYRSERFRSRYDALFGGTAMAAVAGEERAHWGTTAATLAAVRAKLEVASAVRVCGIPNVRLASHRAVVRALSALDADATVADLRSEARRGPPWGIDPDSLVDSLRSDDLDVRAVVTDGADPFCFDLQVVRRAAARAPADLVRQLAMPVATELANAPAKVLAAKALVRGARQRCEMRVPPYMVPARFAVVDGFPLTRSGKLDRQKLSQITTTEVGKVDAKPPSTPVEGALCELFGRVLELSQVGSDDDFFELGGNSLSVFRLVELAKLEGLELSASTVFAGRTVEGIAARLLQATEAARTELSLPAPAPVVGGPSGSQRWVTRGRVLLTGATGLVGAHLVPELQRADCQQVLCLVRAQTDEEAQSRLEASLRERGLLGGVDLRRVTAVAGDLSDDRLGMPEQAFAGLAQQVDMIVHSGARIHIVGAVESLWQTNVGGTAALLRLACRDGARPFHYMSTISAVSGATMPGATRPGVSMPGVSEPWVKGVAEDDTDVGWPSDAYGRTKREAEELVRALGKQGLPVSTYRLGFVAADEAGQHAAIDDALMRFVAGVARIGGFAAPPDWVLRHVGAVDWYARALVALMRAGTDRTVFHVAPPAEVSATALSSWFAAAGYPLDQLAHDACLSRLDADAALNPLRPLLGLLAQRPSFPPRLPLLSTRATGDVLAAAGVPWPLPGPQMLQNWLRLLAAHGRIGPPSQVAPQAGEWTAGVD